MTDKPLVEPHIGPAPSDLLIEDIVVGEGALAESGATVVVHYVGVAASTGEEFDASWNRGDTFSFPLGSATSSPAGTRESPACALADADALSSRHAWDMEIVARAASSPPARR